MKRWSIIGLAGVIIVYAGLAVAMSRVTPFNKGPDEETNLAYTEFIVNYGRLPVNYEERELIGKDANWPPLYHFIVGYLSRGLGVELEGPPYIKVFWDSFRYRAIDAGQEWYYLRTEDQLWPYHGRMLVLQLGRWVSVFFGVVTLCLVYYVVLEILPGKVWLALAAAAILAFIPMFTFMSGVMNEDTLMAAMVTAYLWSLIYAIKNDNKVWPYWAAGIILGISITVKYTPIILPLEVILLTGIVAWQQEYRWRWWLKRVAMVGAGAILASSWWFGWNFWHLNRIEDLGLISGLLYPIFAGGPDVTLSRLGYFLSGGEIGLADLPEGRASSSVMHWASKTYLSVWAVSIGGQIPWYDYAYPVIALVLGLAIFGLWHLWRIESVGRTYLWLLGLHVAILTILPLVRFGLSRRIGETAQGRHIFMPAAAAVTILLTLGIANGVPQKWRRWLFPVIIAGLIGWTGLHWYRLSIFEPPVPLRTFSEAAGWLSDPVEAQFGEAIELASYELAPEPENSLVRLSLAWRSLAYTHESYLLKVKIVDPEERVVSHWAGYNGRGQLPTLAWDPGDAVFDRLVLALPAAPAATYQVQIQLLGRAGPVLVKQDGTDQGDWLSLGSFAWTNEEQFPLPEQIMLEGDAGPTKISFSLWPGAEEANEYPVYRYPVTISIVVSESELNDARLNLALVDATGQVWPATEYAANIYNFVVGPGWPSGGYHLQARLDQNEQMIAQAVTEPLLTVENWWPRNFERPEIETPLEANFADQLKLLGYYLPQNQVKAGEALPITLYWQALSEGSPQANFIQFNQLLDSEGRLRGGYDRQPLEYYSTLLWSPGEIITDGYAVPVDMDAPPGQYYLNVGYYLPVGESAVNLPLITDGQMSEQSSVTIGPIDVIEPVKQ